MRNRAPSRKLAAVAQLLKAERLPYHVGLPLPVGMSDQFPAPGWYWVPAGKNTTEFLGYDAYDAYHQLMLRYETELTAV